MFGKPISLNLMMPRYANVTDELLSAYLDDAVTTSERALIDAAVADDPDIAWRLATLQHTVSLLGKLPEIPLPRSFVLTEAMIGEPSPEAAGVLIPASIPRPRSVQEPEQAGFWQALRSFWQDGNALMRNAATASFAAFLVLAVASGTLYSPTMSQTLSMAPLPEALSEEAAQGQSADSMQVQSAESMTNLPPESAMMYRDSSASGQALRTRSTPSPREAPAAMIVESAPAEPVPLLAESADEAQGAVALAAESIASPVAEHAVVTVVPDEQPAATAAENADEVLRAASAPIAAASVAMADEPATDKEIEAESRPADNEAAPAAAPMAMAAPVADETVETSADAVAMDNSDAEKIVQAEVIEATTIETSATAVSDDADAATESADVDFVAMTEVEMDNSAMGDDAKDAPAIAPAPTIAGQAEVAPVEKAGTAEPMLSTQSESSTTTSTSAMSVSESNPLRFIQMIALSLTLLFASLWLLSRRTQSSRQ